MDWRKFLVSSTQSVKALTNSATGYYSARISPVLEQHKDFRNYCVAQAFIALLTLFLNSMDAIAWIGVIQLVITAVYSIRVSKHVLDSCVIFIAFSYILHLGQYLLQATDIAVTPTADITTYISMEYLIAAGRLTILTHICIAIGNGIYHKWRAVYPVKKLRSLPFETTEHATSKYIAFFMIGVGLLASLYTNITLLILMIQGGYINTYSHSISGMVRLLEYFWVIGVVILFGLWQNNKKSCRILLASSLLYLCITMFTGNRMFAFANIFVLCQSYIYIVEYPRPFATVLIGIVGIFFVSFVVNIGLNRFAGPTLSFDLTGSLSTLFGKVLAEFGGTGYTLALTMEHVPTDLSYLFGLTYPLILIYIFPNFGWNNWSIISATCYSEYLRQFTTSGLGGSYIGEAYFNFGYFSLILMIAFGFFLTWFGERIHLYIQKKHWLRLAPFVSTLPYLLMVSRGFIKDIVRPFTWAALLIFVLLFAVRWLKQRKNNKA